MTKERLIDMDDDQFQLLNEIIARHIPGKTVWAYGSRVKWNANEYSDLDLAIFGCNSSEMGDIRDAFMESDLLMSVSALDWNTIPDSFKKCIKMKYVVLQDTAGLADWHGMRLDEACEIIGGGTPKTSKPEYWNGDIPWLTPRDLSNFSARYISKGERNITELGLRESNASLVPQNAVLLTTRAPVGYLAIAKNQVSTNQGFKSLVPNKQTDNVFLFYLLKQNVEYLKAHSEGTTFGELSGSTLKSLKFLFPSLAEQKVIAEVLSSLDEKIALLHRQNKTLEKLAQTMFHQWFMREPKRNWKKCSLDEIAEYLNGLACQKYPPQNDTDKLPVLKIRELNNGVTDSSDWATSQIDQKYIVALGDVIFSWSGSLMVKIWDGQNCVLNQHLFKVTSTQYPKWFFYLWTKHHLREFVSIADSKSTTMGHIKRDNLSSAVTFVPPANKLREMNQPMEPIFDNIIFNYRKLQTLHNTRDALLPKLVSGEVRIMQ